MKYRKLRIAFSAVCGVICLLLIVLWVRSYWKSDMISHLDSKGRKKVLGSNYGTVYFTQMNVPLVASGPPHGWKYETGDATDSRKHFEWASGSKNVIRVPNLPLATVLALAACLAPVRLPKRFSLRTLLIGITLVAVALGLIFALSR